MKNTDLIEKRKSLGLTQLELANLLHVSQRTIQRWESGVNFPAYVAIFFIEKLKNKN